MSRTHRILAAPTALAAALVAGLLPAPPPARAATPALPPAAARLAVRYVALGDSFAAAPGVPEEADAGCGRSTHNYPHLVARDLKALSFKDMTCNGASAAGLAGQFTALTADTTLVTLTIGGNDGGFTRVIAKCTALGFLKPSGSPCRDHYGNRLTARVAAAAPKVAQAIRTVHRRSPRARVLLVGYLNVIPDDGRSCRPRVMFTDGDMPFLNGYENRLNAMLAAVARAEGAVFADNHPASAAHDVCRRRGIRWTEGLVPTSPSLPFHPNARGQRAMADRVLAALRR